LQYFFVITLLKIAYKIIEHSKKNYSN